jgi:cation transport regulator ChaB
MDKIKIYVVDGVRYNVGPNREQEFLNKFPNATFIEEKEKEGKETAVANQGASVTAQQAPTTELKSEVSSSESAYEIPEKLRLSTEEKEQSRKRYIEEANAGPIEEYKTMSFKEYRESGLMPPEDEKFYTGSGTKRVKITKNAYDSFIEEAKKQVDPENELAVIEKAKALYVEDRLEQDKFKKVEDYLRDEAGVFTDDLRTFRNIQSENIEKLQKDIESDIDKNYQSFVKINGEIGNIIDKAQKIKNATYSSESERLKAKEEFIQLRETANVLASSAAKRHEAIMSSSEIYKDNATLLDIYKREYTDAGVLAGGLAAMSSELVGGAFKLPEWLVISTAQAFGKGKEARAIWDMYSRFAPAADASNQLFKFGEDIRSGIAKPLDISEINSLSDVGSWSADLIGNQLPILATLAATGGAGLGVISASAAGQKYNDMAKEMDMGLEDYNAAQLLFAPMIVAGAEAVSESISLGQIRGVKNVFKKSGKNEIVKSANKYIKENILKPKYLTDVAGESLSEGFATLSENLTDIFLLDKKKSAWEGVPNAMASGAFMSGVVFKSPVLAAKMLAPFNDMNEMQSKLNKNINQINKIQQALDNEDLNSDVKQSLRESLDTIYKDNLQLVVNSYKDLSNFSVEDGKRLVDIDIQYNRVSEDLAMFQEVARANFRRTGEVDPMDREMIRDFKKQQDDLLSEKGQIIKPYAQQVSIKRRFTPEEIKKKSEEDQANFKKLNDQLGITTKVFETAIEAEDWLIDNTNLTIGMAVDYAQTSHGLMLPGRLAKDKKPIGIIIKEKLSETQSIITTGLHEGMHSLLLNTAQKQPEFVMDMGKKLLDFLIQNTEGDVLKGTRFYERFKSYLEDKNYAETSTYEEVMTLLSEEIELGNIKFEETFATKLGDVFRGILQSFGVPIKFEKGRDVFNFVRDYNKAYKRGKLNKAQQKLGAGNFKQSKLTEAEQQNVETFIKQSKIEPEENDRLAKLLETNQTKFLTDSKLDKLIGGVANSITKRYWDPIPGELKQGIQREEFFNTVASNLQVTALKWNPERQDIGKYLANMGFLQNKTLARDEFGIEQSIEEGGAGFKADFETSKEAQMMASDDIMPGEKGEKAPAPKDRFKDKLPFDHVYNGTPVKDIAAQKLERVVRLATKKITAQISNNQTITPFVKEIKNELSFGLEQEVISMMMNYSGGLEKFLLDNKNVIVDNLPTDYMLKHPLFRKLVQKSYQAGPPKMDNMGNLVKEPKWISAVEVEPGVYDFLDARGNKIDPKKFDRRSGIRRDGRKSVTSGMIFKRRHPDAATLLKNDEFVNQFLKGKDKQFVYELGVSSLAKQIASEYAFEVLSDDLKVKGPIYQRLQETADLLDIAINSTINDQLVKDIERGDIKLSKKVKNTIYDDQLYDNLYNIVTVSNIAKKGPLGYVVQQKLYPELQGEDAVELHNAIKKSIEKNTPFDTDVLTEEGVQRLDKMLFDKKGIPMEEMTDYAANIYANTHGKRRKKLRYVPSKFDDFWGLMYYMVRKGKDGDADIKWIQDNIMNPYTKGHLAYITYRQNIVQKHQDILKVIRKKGKLDLTEINETGVTNEDAVRLLIWSRLRNEDGTKLQMPEGTSQEDVKKQQEAIRYARKNPLLNSLATQLQYLFPEGYPAPTKTWQSQGIYVDIVEHLNEKSRKDFMSEFIAKTDEAFGKLSQSGKLEGSFANKLEAAFGKDYVDDLGDMIYRMRAGRARKIGSDTEAKGMTDWVNNATGTVMFLNVRSAALQLVSIGNYINMEDNNFIEAGQAFANQQQYWKDFSFLLTSDYLKARRGGTQLDIRAEEIAKIAQRQGTKNLKGLTATLLQKGFFLTQAADSLAISLGGATFYRNRLNRYLKEGKSEQEAQEQAFQDFVEATEESQQSSRQDRLSKVQMSAAGRLLFAFGNTPMQYSRVTKKAALDLINGRGSAINNLSRLLYYGGLQNIIFSGLQNALFYTLLRGDGEDEEIEDKTLQALNSTFDTIMRASGYWGLAISTLKTVGMEAYRQSQKSRPDYVGAAIKTTTVSPPIGSKLNKIIRAAKEIQYGANKQGTEGFGLNNPYLRSSALLIEAGLNLPTSRLVEKSYNVQLALDGKTDTAQDIMLMIGYKDYQLNIEDERAKKKKSSANKLRKKETRKKL